MAVRGRTRAKFHSCAPFGESSPFTALFRPDEHLAPTKRRRGLATLPNNYQAMEAILREPMTQRHGIFKRVARARKPDHLKT